MLPVPDLNVFGEGTKLIQDNLLLLAVVIVLEIVVMLILQNYIQLPNWIFKIVFVFVIGLSFTYLLFNQYLPNIINGL